MAELIALEKVKMIEIVTMDNPQPSPKTLSLFLSLHNKEREREKERVHGCSSETKCWWAKICM